MRAERERNEKCPGICTNLVFLKFSFDPFRSLGAFQKEQFNLPACVLCVRGDIVEMKEREENSKEYVFLKTKQ